MKEKDLSAEEKVLRLIFGEKENNSPSAQSRPADPKSYSRLKEAFTEVLESLTERERKVMELRFGLGDGYSLTLEETGKQFKVTRERIRQIEAKALRKMRHPTRVKHLEEFLGETETDL